MDIEPMEEGEGLGGVFLAIVALILLGFTNVVGSQLVGQSLLGPPNYIVQPDNSLF